MVLVEFPAIVRSSVRIDDEAMLPAVANPAHDSKVAISFGNTEFFRALRMIVRKFDVAGVWSAVRPRLPKSQIRRIGKLYSPNLL